MSELLRQGLVITGLGMGLVFAALTLLWVIMAALTRIFATEASPGKQAGDEPGALPTLMAQAEADALTAERGQVAALMAAALMANALPWVVDLPPGPVFEHGRSAPSWVSANRARNLQSWQPPRHVER